MLDTSGRTVRQALKHLCRTLTFSFLTDVGLPDIWVVDPQVQYIEDIKPLRDTEVLRAGNDIFTTAAKDVVVCGGKSQAWTRPARSM
jgi:hypothetical protein